MKNTLIFRLIDSSDLDSIRLFSDFLSICYKDRFFKGITCLPYHQDTKTTCRRIQGAEVWISEKNGRIIASFSIVLPSKTAGSWWYRKPNVSEINQIAIHPDYQGKGYFQFILDSAEKRAMELGIHELAGSVLSQRKWLIKAYLHRGYRIVDYKWKTGYNYGSVIVSKTIQGRTLKSGFLRRFGRRLKYFRRYVKYGILKGKG
jgi:GNAT superfamily N-acetyltransferase